MAPAVAYVESSKVVHAALLLLMLEAVFTDLAFIISLKRSTLIFSYPQAGRPITPSFGGTAVIQRTSPGIAEFDPLLPFRNQFWCSAEEFPARPVC